MSPKRMLLAAVGVALSGPAFAREEPKDEPKETWEAAVLDIADPLTADEAAPPVFEAPVDISVCEITTANTKGPSYDDKCLAQLK